ncbi:MAG: FHA domain-containing protein [Acidobacteriia bacterium]|nr:FHA domain-containing protein [Terriglobia bacterium]
MMQRCSNGHEFNSDFGPECPVCMPADLRPGAAPVKRTVVDQSPSQLPPTQATSAPTVVVAGAGSKRIVGWVVVERGPQRDKDFRLYEGQNRVGRDANSHIVLSDPLAGGAHAVINYDGTRFEIIDLASKNGTFLNEKSTTVTREELKNGDVIRIGDTSLQFIRRV